MLRGVARGETGIANGGMGTDAADYDGSGWPSLWVTNFEGQWHGLYRNQGGGSFIFSSPGAGIAALGQQFVGFGTAFLDLDRHGWEDLVIVDGHVYRYP